MKLKHDALSNAADTSSVSFETVFNGTAKAWLSYNQATPAVLGSSNVTSVTDTGTGLFTANWTSSFSDANYAPTATTDNGSHTNAGFMFSIETDKDNLPLAGSTPIETVAVSASTSRTYNDQVRNTLAVHGDLA